MSYPQPKLPTSNELIEKHSQAKYITFVPLWNKSGAHQNAIDQVKRYK